MTLLGLIPLEGDGWKVPGVDDFFLPPIFEGVAGLDWFNRGTLMAIVGAAIVITYWLMASRKHEMVPGKFQYFAESFYNQIRNGVAREALGSDGRRYLPYLLGLFCFIWVNNLWGQVFFTMYPTFANIGYAYGLAFLTWVIYIGAGIHKHGLKYFKLAVLPAGVPLWLTPLIIPLEILSNFVVRPFTLALRLFANLFAGHLVVLVFVAGGWFLLSQADNFVYRGAGAVSMVFSFAIFALELLIGLLQAYIFTVLTAQYVASSLAEDH